MAGLPEADDGRACGTCWARRRSCRVKRRLVAGEARTEGDLVVQRVAYPSEARLVVPTVLLAPAARSGKLPVTVVLAGDGKEALVG